MKIKFAKFAQLLVLLACVFSLSACMKKSGSSGASPTVIVSGTPKPLAKIWSNSGFWYLNWTNAVTNGSTFSLVYTQQGVGGCSCTGTITGTESSGTCTITSCSWTQGTTNPDCAGNGYFGVCSGGYTNDGVNLKFGGSAIVYE